MYFEEWSKHPGTYLCVAALVIILLAILFQVGVMGNDPNIDKHCSQKSALWGTLYATGGFLAILGVVEYWGKHKMVTTD